MDDREGKPMGNVILVDEARIRHHLGALNPPWKGKTRANVTPQESRQNCSCLPLARADGKAAVDSL